MHQRSRSRLIGSVLRCWSSVNNSQGEGLTLVWGGNTGCYQRGALVEEGAGGVTTLTVQVAVKFTSSSTSSEHLGLSTPSVHTVEGHTVRLYWPNLDMV